VTLNTLRARMRTRAALTIAALIAVGFCAGAAQATPFVVRATAKVQQLGDYNITANPTLQGVTDAFGEPDQCLLRSYFGLAVWRTDGFRIKLTTLGGLATGTTYCTDPDVFVDAVLVTGKRWHTARGLAIGDTLAKFHRLYPRAHHYREGWGVAEMYTRCVIGICPKQFEWVARLIASFRNGRLATFVFPVGAQGE
jgi:hypothetical protein